MLSLRALVGVHEISRSVEKSFWLATITKKEEIRDASSEQGKTDKSIL